MNFNSQTKKINTIIIVLLNFLNFSSTQLLEGIYCGKENCYDVLNVGRDSIKSEISKSYRKLAKQFHPDMHRGKEAKLEAEEQFKIVANAYEILKDDESRTDYDYMLDNPEEYYAHYYRYYRRRVTPKVDVKIVILVTISIISLVQYYSAWQRYDSAITYFSTIPKYRNKAVDIAKQDGLIPDGGNNYKKMNNNNNNNNGNRKLINKKMSKSEIEQVIKKIIEDKMDIKGAYAKPKITDVIWIQFIIFPYTVVKYFYWYFSWIWKHNILNEPYNEEEKLYIIRKFMKMGQHQFDAEDDEKIQKFLDKELWIREKFDKWFLEEEELVKKQLAENNRYKQYRRYLKNHGVGRMTFDDS